MPSYMSLEKQRTKDVGSCTLCSAVNDYIYVLKFVDETNKPHVNITSVRLCSAHLLLLEDTIKEFALRVRRSEGETSHVLGKQSEKNARDSKLFEMHLKGWKDDALKTYFGLKNVRSVQAIITRQKRARKLHVEGV